MYLADKVKLVIISFLAGCLVAYLLHMAQAIKPIPAPPKDTTIPIEAVFTFPNDRINTSPIQTDSY